MNHLKQGSKIFFIALAFSVLFHTVLIARMAGLEILGPGFFSSGVLTATFEKEDAYPFPALNSPKKSSRAAEHQIRRKKTIPAAVRQQPPEEEKVNEQQIPAQIPVPVEPQDSIGCNVPVEKTEIQKEEGADISTRSQKAEDSGPAREIPEPRYRILTSTKEVFYYDIYWVGMLVGRAILEAVNEGGEVRIVSQVHSAPLISTFYKVEDYAESRVVNGLPSYFRIKQREGKYRSDKETIFDPEKGRITYSNYLKGTTDNHEARGVLWDVISAFYFLRTREFEVGKALSLNIFDSNKFLKADVNVIRKEKVSFGDKKDQDAVVVKPMLNSEGLFQNKGEILIWLTDDLTKIPVKVETKVPIGTVVAKLTRMEKQ